MQFTEMTPVSAEAHSHYRFNAGFICMHTLKCTPTCAHRQIRPHTHTLTQFSKELNSQSCIDEEQQHEEQTQIPHL